MSALPSHGNAQAGSTKADWPAALVVLRSASREELLSYGRDLLAHGDRLENVVTLLQFLAGDRPNLAIELARDLGRTDGERQVFLYATLSAWAGQDAPAAVRWAFEQSDAYNIPGRASLLYVTIEEIAADNPRAAIDTAEAALRDTQAGASARDVARFTLEALIKTSHIDLAQSALETWASGPEAKRLSGPDFEIVAMALAGQSFKQAGAWLDTQGNSPARNDACLPFAMAWAEQDPVAAMDWAQQLGSASGGDDVRVATFARWLKSDRSAAMQWLAGHNASDSTRDRFLSLVNAPAARP